MIQIERRDYFYVPLGFVNKVERVLDKKKQDDSTVEVTCKDCKYFKLFFNKSQCNDSMTLTQLIHKNAFIEYRTALFAMTHFSKNSQLESKYHGWEIYKVEAEFER